jgi:hypothetical protein
MAVKGKAEKRIPIDSGETAPAVTPEETTPAAMSAESAPPEAASEALASEAATVESQASEAAAEIVDIVSAPLAVIEEAVESAAESFSASFDFDASAWSKKSLELWAENASAFLAFAEQAAKAKSFDELLDLQSRFASERFEAFVRQSNEIMEAAKSMTSFAAAPLCDTRKAA